MATTTLKEVIADIHARYPGVVLHYWTFNKAYNVDLIFVPSKQRCQGIGTKVLAELTAAADENNWELYTTPDTAFSTDLKRLTQFYLRAGFLPSSNPKMGDSKLVYVPNVRWDHPMFDEPVKPEPKAKPKRVRKTKTA